MTTADTPGRLIIRASWFGTGLLAATSMGALVRPDPLGVPYAALAVVAFSTGSIAFFVAFARAVGRSRFELISVADVYLLTQGAPATVRRQLLGSLGAQVAVALITASLRPFTVAAFGILAPVYGLGLAGSWSAFHGTFPRR